MNLSYYEILDLAKEGASLVFDGSSFNEYELKAFAEAIQDGCTLELQGCNSRGTDELKAIAQCAPGKVRFISRESKCGPMNKSHYEMIDLARAGVSLIFDVSEFGEYEIKSIAEAIQDRCTLELQGCDSKGIYELKTIAQYAPGKVKFSF